MTKCNLTQEPDMVVSCKRFHIHQFWALPVVVHMNNACTYNDLNAEDVQGGELQEIVWVGKTCRWEHRLLREHIVFNNKSGTRRE